MTSALTKEIVGLKRRVRILETAPRLAAASLEGQPLPSFDNDGKLRAIIGAQPDGSHTVVVKDGPTPLQPTDPGCVGHAYAIAVTWDGSLIGPFGQVDADLPLYDDFDACEVHVGLTEGFISDQTTLAGVIGRGGGTVNVASLAGQVWVRLRIRSQAGKVGPPSPSVGVEVSELVDPDIFDQLERDLIDLALEVDESGAELAQRLADARRDLDQARIDLDAARDALAQVRDVSLPGLVVDLDAAKGKLDSAFPTGVFPVATQITQTASATATAAALDAQTKADAAAAAAEQAAKDFAAGKATEAETAAKQAAAADAAAKADAARDAAIAAAATDATDKASAAQQAALSGAQGYANTARQAAIDAAAADAQTKADAAAAAAEQAAKAYAEAQASGAGADALAAAKTHAEQQAAAAQQAAEEHADAQAAAAQAAAATDATNKAATARQAAIDAAAADALTKANTAAAAAEQAAKAYAEAQASGASDAALVAAKTYAEQQAQAAQTAAEAAAQTKADAAKNAAIDAAALTAQTKADVAKQAAIDAAAADATAKANVAKAAADAAATAASTANDAAQAAAGLAGTKGETIVQTSAPTGAKAVAQNLWIRLPDNVPHRWNPAASGTNKWQPITDKAATDAAAAAAAAQARAEAVKTEAINAAAADATSKASAAQQAAITQAGTLAATAKSEAISAAATDATTKANNAKTAAETAAKAYADAEAEAARLAAIATASGDATDKANAAKAQALADAAADAKTKADAARDAAITQATTLASTAKSEAISAAATDATTKANAAKTAAETAAKTHADAQAEAARLAAIATASGDATDKANAAKAQAVADAAADAATKANAARDAAISTAATDATTKANNARTSAISTAATDATTKANAARDAAIQSANTAIQNATNLIDNPSRTGVVGRWRSSSPSIETLSIETVDVDGRAARALRITSTGNGQTYSSNTGADHFDVDPSKAYLISFDAWDEKLVSGTQFYFGITTFDIAGSSAAANAGVIPVNATTGTAGAASANFYFISLGSPPVGQWRRYVGYLMPHGTDPASMKGLGVNVNSNAILAPGTAKARVRILNYSNAGTTRYVDVLNPSVVEVDPQSVLTGLAAQGTAVEARGLAVGAQGTADEARGLAVEAQGAADAAQGTADAAQGAADDAQEAADEAQQTADAAVISADGKNTNTYSDVTSNPGPTPTVAFGQGRRQFDTHRNRLASPLTIDGVTMPAGTVLAEWMWTGSSWAPVHLGDAMLRSLDVGRITGGSAAFDEFISNKLIARIATIIELSAEQITSGQINAARINVLNLAAELADIIEARVDKLTVGTAAIREVVVEKLWAEVVRAHKITTDMLLVGSGTNNVVDPYLKDAELTAARITASTGAWTAIPENAFVQSELVFDVPQGSTRTLRYISTEGGTAERVDPVTPGDTYRIRYEHRRLGTSTTGRVRPAIRWMNVAGTAATVYPRTTTVAMSTTWTVDEVEWVAPDDAAGAYLEVVSTSGSSTTRTQIRRPSIVSKTDASLIVDGVVEARHINAQSIAAAVGEFVKVTANNIEAGNVNVALNLTTGGKIIANGGTGKTEIDHSGMFTTDSSGRTILDTRGGQVTMRGSLKTGATDTNGIHIVPDGGRLGNGLIEFRSSTTPRNAEIALESRTGSLAALVVRGPAPTDLTNYPATMTLQYATLGNQSRYEVEADRILLYAAGEALVQSIDGTVRLQGREVVVNGDNIVNEWQTYTPLLRATSSNPVPGSTTERNGRYKKIGTTVHFAVEIILGNMTNRGSGAYRISLPVPAVGLRTYCFGNISPDAIAIGAIEPGVDGDFINRIRFVQQTRTNDTNPTVNNTTPASLSTIRLGGSYECAP